MRQEVICSHCQESFHVHFKSFLLGRLECPHCHSHFRLIPSWAVCFLVAILVVILPDVQLRRTDRLPASPVYPILFISAVLGSPIT